MLNEEGLKAAAIAMFNSPAFQPARGPWEGSGRASESLVLKGMRAAITAYLSTVEKPATGVTDAEIRAFRAKYREMFPKSHPDRATIIELLTASKIAVSDASKAFREHLPTPPASATKGE